MCFFIIVSFKFPFVCLEIPCIFYILTIFSGVCSIFQVFETVQQAHDVPFGSYFEVCLHVTLSLELLYT